MISSRCPPHEGSNLQMCEPSRSPLKATQDRDNLIRTNLPIDIATVDKISVSDFGSSNCSLCAVHILRGEDMRLGLGTADGDEDFFKRAGVLDMKSLHAEWTRKRRCFNATRENGRGIELKVGAMVIAALPRQPKRSEQIVHGTHCHEIGEVEADDSDPTILDVRDHFLENFCILPISQAFVCNEHSSWVVLSQVPNRAIGLFGTLQVGRVG